MKKVLYLSLFLMVFGLISGAVLSAAYKLSNRNGGTNDDKYGETLDTLGLKEVALTDKEEDLVEGVTYLRTGQLNNKEVVVVFVKGTNSFIEIEIGVVFDVATETIFDVVFISNFTTHSMDTNIKEKIIGVLDKGDGIIENTSGATVSTVTVNNLIAIAISQFQELSGFPVIKSFTQDYSTVADNKSQYTVVFEDEITVIATADFTASSIKLAYHSGLPESMSESDKQKYITVISQKSINNGVFSIDGLAIGVFYPNEFLGRVKVIYTFDANGIITAIDFCGSEFHTEGAPNDDNVESALNALIGTDATTIENVTNATYTIGTYKLTLTLAREVFNEVNR